MPPTSPYQLVWQYVRKRWSVYCLGICFVSGTNATEVLIPKGIQWAVDALSPSGKEYLLPTFTSLKRYAGIVAFLVALVVVQALCRRYWRLFICQEMHLATNYLKSLLWDHVHRLPLNHPLATQRGVLLNLFTSDVRNARAAIGFLAYSAADLSFLCCFGIGAMLLIDPWLTCASLSIMIATPFALRHFTERGYSQQAIAQDVLANLNEAVSSAFSSLRLQRLLPNRHLWEQGIVVAATQHRAARLRTLYTTLMLYLFMTAAPWISFIALLVLGMPKVLSGELSIGEFVALQSYIALIKDPLAECGLLGSEWQRSYTSLKRIHETLVIPTERGFEPATDIHIEVPGFPADHLRSTPYVYKAETLQFAYPGETQLAVAPISFAIAPGEKCGITGPVGSGKSTLLALLSGLPLQYQGFLSFAGNEMRESLFAHLRSSIALVPQHSLFVADTIRDNIALGKEINEDELWRMLTVVAIADEVRRMPHGLDTRIEEGGVNLSGGQKQRLSIARALLMKPQILLLDDCLSAVDTLTEAHIVQSLATELAQTTVVWVAHRVSTLRNCTSMLELA